VAASLLRREKYGHMLVDAAAEGDLSEVRHLLMKRASVNFRSDLHSCRHTPLTAAARSGSVEVVRFLLAKKAKVDAPGDQSSTALLHAATHGTKAVLAELLAAGAKLEINLALKRAAYNCHLEAVETLLRNGADLEAQVGRTGNTPLNVIVRRDCCVNMVDYLIERGASVNTYNQLGVTPLLSAIHYQNLRIAKLLVGKGADVNVQDFRGRSPLMIAAQSSSLSAVNYLMHEAKADLTLEDDSGNSALECAARGRDWSATVGRFRPESIISMRRGCVKALLEFSRKESTGRAIRRDVKEVHMLYPMLMEALGQPEVEKEIQELAIKAEAHALLRCPIGEGIFSSTRASA